MKKEKYDPPKVNITLIKNVDIITYSETEEWVGPEIEAGFTAEP